ncbi:ATP-binding cassette sub-family a member 3 [Plakobranchus ocellatus]|uniref:ATP-binding cassette sub-family a member 3 n=1 Tax=Plakobranchus ocellatus TaxID=259542 RepID=A0AAV3YII1_9GAST|nr:ATP-binding cassette sub-family a member 3 [Plakobranchus ocellatus]
MCQQVFDNKVSVSNLTLNMYEGQITILLGHNGAGKTTTMSMLTGFIPPTKGTAFVNGYDINTNIAGVRRSLGLCPQHDILFEVLTVKEHLWFFAKLKGYQTSNLAEEIDNLVTEIGLQSKAKKRVREISAGQKRSLSVGISLMGDSKVVFLDEPSSGMDPSTRRLTWDLLNKKRKGRTMLLSTHYMDEADAIGNRIAILVEGQLQCCGTPLFLKKLYGAGYHLIIEKEPKCDLKKLTMVIQDHIANAQIESAHMFDVSYLLPASECPMFPALFRYLSSYKTELNITAFGTTSTTMEEVFLKSEVINDEHELSQISENRSSTTAMQEGTMNIEHFDNLNHNISFLTGYSLAWSQFRALFMKRLIVALRHWTVTLLLFTLPASIVFLFFLIEHFILPPYDSSRRETLFDLEKYRRHGPIAAFVAGDAAKYGKDSEKVLEEYTNIVHRQKATTVNLTDSQVFTILAN